MKEKLRAAGRYISHRKVPPIWRLLPSRYDPENTNADYLSAIGTSHNSTNYKSPSYVDGNRNVEYKKSLSDGTTNRTFFPVIESDDDEIHLEISPDNSFDKCHFHLLNHRNYEETSISLTGTTSEGKVNREMRYRSGESMNLNAMPVHASFDDSIDKLSIDIQANGHELDHFNGDSTISITTPSIQKELATGTPIFLVSIDTFRYDHLDVFEELESRLGETVVPTEPRTQGRYTRPSHGSIMTGTHPGTHGYCTGFGRQIDQGIPISALSPDLDTVADFLLGHGYSCGACTSWGSVAPPFGFGKGFQEFRLETRDWDKYKRDADTVVDRALDWTERMISAGHTDLFYFMHIFDAHFPYLAFETLSEDEEIDVNMTDKYKRDYINSQPLNYEDLMAHSSGVEAPPYLDELKKYYRRSLENVADSLKRFTHMLDYYGILDESLIIIVGDHGEEFLEEGVVGHATLRDRNIRPGVMINSPEQADFHVPDEVDLIDILPTLADYVAGEVPDQCVGESWLRMDPDEESSRIRITEAFTGDSTYAISIEREGAKGVFAFEADIPDRPTTAQIESGPKYEEIIELERQNGDESPGKSDVEEMKSDLRTKAIEFINSQDDEYQEGENVELSSEAIERLEEMGYK